MKALRCVKGFVCLLFCFSRENLAMRTHTEAHAGEAASLRGITGKAGVLFFPERVFPLAAVDLRADARSVVHLLSLAVSS